MPREINRLSALKVKRLIHPGLYNDGGGLYLRVNRGGSKAWIYRWRDRVTGKLRDKGLGPAWDVSLDQARIKAKQCREQVRDGGNPIDDARDAIRARRAELAKRVTFAWCAERTIEAKRAAWKNAKHAQQWEYTLRDLAGPYIGNMAVRDIELPHVLRVLQPIWETKTETATRLRARMEAVLAWATASGYREGDNPARWKSNLDAVLPKPGKLAKTRHFKALPVDDLHEFMVQLRLRPGMAARALEFTILTAARSGEVRGATWAEIDMQARVWAIPAERMKAGKEHRVPLPARAVALLEALPRAGEYVFPAARGGMLSDMSLTALLRRMKVDATAHGFRSTFRDWTAERTAYPRDVCEMALAHTIDNKVEAAYRRGDLFAKRAKLMEDWSRFIDTRPVNADVVPIRVGKTV